MTFAEMFWNARQAKFIKLRDLARIVRLSPSHLSNMEHGRCKPTRDTEKLKDIALILGIDEAEFLAAATRELEKEAL